MSNNIKAIHASLKKGQAVVIATILSKEGSAPRSAGTSMIIHGDGQISGTIGGGWVEARVQEICKDFFKNRAGVLIQEFTLDSTAYQDMDMVCGGNITLLLEYLPATTENLDFFTKHLEMNSRNKNGFTASRLDKREDNIYSIKRFLIDADNLQWAASPVRLTDKTVAQLADHADVMRSPGLVHLEGATFFVEPARFNGVLYILGAGHLAIETARFASRIGFKTVVMDDRDEFANRQRFPMAEIHVLKNFDSCFDGFAVGDGSYIVIMTRGHLYDRTILEQALETKATYIGMIGSRSKKKVIYDYLLNRGVSQERLDLVHSPIGLAINAQTPEEIAVSIVAELIQERFNAL
jgi:xanthine dehydrogenase accessory factor